MEKLRKELIKDKIKLVGMYIFLSLIVWPVYGIVMLIPFVNTYVELTDRRNKK